MIELESSSPEETERIARALAAELRAGDVVTVSGELGSGKTTFVRGACRALGVTAPVTSPTFTVGHRYRSRLPGIDVSHLDFYRFEGMSDSEWGDLEPYLEEAIVFVEWPEAAEGYLPEPRARVSLRHLGGDRRLVGLESSEESLEHRVSHGARAGV
jgi:tRNA threonylcarbamoyladenosine biosynthesis protein TsaE